MTPAPQCSRCADQSIGFNDNGEALCSDCLFEEYANEMHSDHDEALLDEEFDEVF